LIVYNLFALIGRKAPFTHSLFDYSIWVSETCTLYWECVTTCNLSEPINCYLPYIQPDLAWS